MGIGSENARTRSEGLQKNTFDRVAIGLGWFSLGLGLAEVAAPRSLAKVIGVRGNTKTRRMLRSPLYGLREIAAGVAILSQPGEVRWLWGRVAGDAMDIGTLVSAFRSYRNDKKRLTGALLAVGAVTALDCVCAAKMGCNRSEGLAEAE